MLTSVVEALSFHPRMDRALWVSRSHVLSCKLIQPIPDFGRAIFNQEAGGKAFEFYLETLANPFEKGHAVLTSKAPTWNPDMPETYVGKVHVVKGDIPVHLSEKLSTQLLSELYKGKSPSFVRKAWYQEDEPVEVALSSATFRAAYRDYRLCLKNLLPVGFDKLERSRVQFDTDKWELTDKTIEWLDIIANYLRLAGDIEQFFIDGHTDDTHITTYNIELSRKRAEAVADYLVSQGVSRNQLTVRFHGERYPIKSNKTPFGRAENRRVTLRVQLSQTAIASR